MVINTGKGARDRERTAVPVPPDKAPARKKTAQKPMRSRRTIMRPLVVVKFLTLLSVPALITAGAFFALRHASTSNLLALRQITVEGCRTVEPAAVEAILREEFYANLLRIDLKEVCERLQAEPWIRRAEARRIFPSSMRIRITERIPSVIAEIGGEMQMLDEEGVLLDRYTPAYGQLDVPVFRGLQGDSAEAYRVMQEENFGRVTLGVRMLRELDAGEEVLTRFISEVDLSQTSNIRILLVDDTIEVYLGDRDFLNRFRAFMSQYRDVRSKHGDLVSADLRFFPKIVYQTRQSSGGQEPGPGTSNSLEQTEWSRL